MFKPIKGREVLYMKKKMDGMHLATNIVLLKAQNKQTSKKTSRKS